MSTITVAVLGARGVGKSTLVQYFANEIRPEYTLSGDVYKFNHPIGHGTARSIKIVDLHPSIFSSVFRARVRHQMKHADAFVVVYDVANVMSYSSAIDTCLKIYSKKGCMDVPLILVGNKADLSCKISDNQLRQRGDLPRVITIGRNGGNVNFMFDLLLRFVLEEQCRNRTEYGIDS